MRGNPKSADEATEKGLRVAKVQLTPHAGRGWDMALLEARINEIRRVLHLSAAACIYWSTNHRKEERQTEEPDRGVQGFVHRARSPINHVSAICPHHFNHASQPTLNPSLAHLCSSIPVARVPPTSTLAGRAGVHRV